MKITKIIGEVIDLESGESAAHALIVSNGREDIQVPVSAEAVRLIAEFYLRSQGVRPMPPLVEGDDSTMASISDMSDRWNLANTVDDEVVPDEEDDLPSVVDGNGVEFTPSAVSPVEQDDEQDDEYADEFTGIRST